MAIAVLPVELWAPIIECAPSKADLASLSQVSKSFQYEAERMLYRSVILQPNDATLAVALTSSRRRALLVHECTLYLPRVTSSRPHNNNKPTAAHALFSLLQRMRHLTSLTIRGPLPSNLFSFNKSLTFSFQLQTLCTTDVLSKPLLALLRLQPTITRFTTLAPTAVPSSQLAGVLPNIHALAAVTPDAALALLPHRPVTHLHILTLNDAAPADVLPSIGESSGPLRALMCARGLELTPSDMGLVALHLPNLAFLGDVSVTDDMAAYLPALASMASLKTLLVNEESRGFKARFAEAAVVKAVGHACKSMERIVFTRRGTAGYVWERKRPGRNEWCVKRMRDPVEVAADLWRAT